MSHDYHYRLRLMAQKARRKTAEGGVATALVRSLAWQAAVYELATDDEARALLRTAELHAAALEAVFRLQGLKAFREMLWGLYNEVRDG